MKRASYPPIAPRISCLNMPPVRAIAVCAPSSPAPAGAAHLPGMLAAKTTIPVLGVPIPTRQLKGMDSLLSIVQMPKGVPVATFAIGEAGAANAGLFAVSLLSVAQDGDAPRYHQQLDGFRARSATGAGAHPGGAGMILPPPLWVCSVAASSAATS